MGWLGPVCLFLLGFFIFLSLVFNLLKTRASDFTVAHHAHYARLVGDASQDCFFILFLLV
jgi:hypothetical protein